MKMQGFCTDIEESQCPYRTNPAEKLKIFTRQCILFENSGELSLKINNYKAVVKISGKSGLIIHKKDKNGTVQYIPNTPLITSIYISAFREIPARDISDSEALDLINHWLSKAGRIVVEDEDDLILQEVVDIIVSGEYDIYKLELLKTGELTTVDGFFSDGKNIYIETNFLRQILEQHGITISRRKLVKPLKRVLAVKGSKLERVGEKRYRFWIFNIQAIKQCVKDDVEWEPQILEKPPSFDDLLDSDVVGGEGAESLDSVDEGVDDSSTGGDDGGTTECAKEDVYDNLEEDWDSSL
ncbi:hypothetical protein [Archaeoglobus sulfaticallidus]|nr:hypothetical protein [Archaeoglobus sulfaticallidus]